MRDIETIDGELRLLARAWGVAREFGCTPSTRHIDKPPNERSKATTSRPAKILAFPSFAAV
jgi:hypothetical protein